jgi:hypothetical protein
MLKNILFVFLFFQSFHVQLSGVSGNDFIKGIDEKLVAIVPVDYWNETEFSECISTINSLAKLVSEDSSVNEIFCLPCKDFTNKIFLASYDKQPLAVMVCLVNDSKIIYEWLWVSQDKKKCDYLDYLDGKASEVIEKQFESIEQPLECFLS